MNAAEAREAHEVIDHSARAAIVALEATVTEVIELLRKSIDTARENDESAAGSVDKLAQGFKDLAGILHGLSDRVGMLELDRKAQGG